jgi:hypothetical protein
MALYTASLCVCVCVCVCVYIYIYIYIYIYRVIHKSLRDFRPLRYSSRDGHVEGDHVNRGRDTPTFCPTLQVFDMCILGDAADVNPVIGTGLTSAASPSVHISSTCKVGQKLVVSLPLLTWSPSTWPSRLLYRRGRKSRRDLWITLYIYMYVYIYIYIYIQWGMLERT